MGRNVQTQGRKGPCRIRGTLRCAAVVDLVYMKRRRPSEGAAAGSWQITVHAGAGSVSSILGSNFSGTLRGKISKQNPVQSTQKNNFPAYQALLKLEAALSSHMRRHTHSVRASLPRQETSRRRGLGLIDPVSKVPGTPGTWWTLRRPEEFNKHRRNGEMTPYCDEKKFGGLS